MLSALPAAMAQFTQQCVDSNRIQPFFSCNRPEFLPVCGCNQVTYRNDCVSFNNHGVNITSDGVCLNDVFFFDFWPNVVNDQVAFYLKSAIKVPATIEIIDAFGKLQFYRVMNTIPEPYFSQTFYFREYRPGVYYFVVRSGKKIQSKKFVKY